jgi:predicted DNA-binding transcriptional regulator AlpA
MPVFQDHNLPAGETQRERPAPSAGTDFEPLLKPFEAAELLSCSLHVLGYMRRNSRGPRYIQLGRNLFRYRKSDIMRWIQEQTVPANGNAGFQAASPEAK